MPPPSVLNNLYLNLCGLRKKLLKNCNLYLIEAQKCYELISKCFASDKVLSFFVLCLKLYAPKVSIECRCVFATRKFTLSSVKQIKVFKIVAFHNFFVVNRTYL